MNRAQQRQEMRRLGWRGTKAKRVRKADPDVIDAFRARITELLEEDREAVEQ